MRPLLGERAVHARGGANSARAGRTSTFGWAGGGGAPAGEPITGAQFGCRPCSGSRASCVKLGLVPKNDSVRTPLTPPERAPFKPASLRVSSNPLSSRASYIRTKTGVVRLRQRKRAERDGKRLEMSRSAGPGGSDISSGRPAFCGMPAAGGDGAENVPNRQTGGGSGIRTHGTLARTTVFETAPFDRSGIPPLGISTAWATSGFPLRPNCHPKHGRSYHERLEPAKAALIAAAALPSSLRNRWA
jgi:hypothetical protein